MKELVKKDFNKLSILLQQAKSKSKRDESHKYFSVKKVHSDKVLNTSFYKPISKVL
jgi:hypothetical protein